MRQHFHFSNTLLGLSHFCTSEAAIEFSAHRWRTGNGSDASRKTGLSRSLSTGPSHSLYSGETFILKPAAGATPPTGPTRLISRSSTVYRRRHLSSSPPATPKPHTYSGLILSRNRQSFHSYHTNYTEGIVRFDSEKNSRLSCREKWTR